MKRNRIIALVLTLIVVMTSMSFAADGVSGENYAHKAKYMSSWDNSRDGELTYYFLESYFNTNSTTYNSHLATASMALAMAGNSNSDQNIKNALTDLGCTNYVSQDYGTSSAESIGVAVAKKVLTNGKTLLPVIIRGAGYENEWDQNFIAGTSGNAEGYEAPANKVEAFVKKQLGDDQNAIIWIMGYSRGGAVANLAAAKLSKEYDKSKVYAYCFDAPMAASPADSSYGNIHIVKNTYDGITLVLPEYMGFGSHGTINKQLGPDNEQAMLAKLKEFSNESNKFASPSKLKWGKFALNLDLNSSTLMSDAIAMYMKGKPFYETKEGSTTTPSELWNELLKRLKKAIPSRSAYADTGVQDGAVAAVRLVRGLTDVQKNSLKNSIKDTNTLMALLGNKDLIGALASVQSGKDPALSDNQYENIASTIYGALFNKGTFNATQKEDANTALKVLVKPLFTVLADDYVSNKQILGTLMLSGNLDILAQCHYPEVNMAWLMTEDTYYNGETPKEESGDDPEPVKVATTKISKVTAAKKAFTVKWTKKTSNLDGYQIQYSTKSNFSSGAKIKKVTSKKTTSKKITGLKAKTKYYVRVRCYRNVDGTLVPGKWSSAKKVTTKK